MRGRALAPALALAPTMAFAPAFALFLLLLQLFCCCFALAAALADAPAFVLAPALAFALALTEISGYLEPRNPPHYFRIAFKGQR